MFTVGQIVQSTGAMGTTIIFGKVLAVGPKTFTVRWESGIVNRPRHDADVKPADLGDFTGDELVLLRRRLENT